MGHISQAYVIENLILNILYDNRTRLISKKKRILFIIMDKLIWWAMNWGSKNPDTLVSGLVVVGYHAWFFILLFNECLDNWPTYKWCENQNFLISKHMNFYIRTQKHAFWWAINQGNILDIKHSFSGWVETVINESFCL